MVPPVTPFGDAGERPFVLGTRDGRVAVGVEPLKGAHGERARGLAPQASELLEAELAVAIGIVGGEGGAAVLARLGDLRLRESPVPVGIDGARSRGR